MRENKPLKEGFEFGNFTEYLLGNADFVDSVLFLLCI